MIPVTQFLLRFKSLTNTEKVKKELVCVDINKIIGTNISFSNISFSKNTIFIKASPIYKVEILLKKEEILQKIKTLPGLGNISDIK